MSDLNRLTKAEIIKKLEEEKQKVAALEKEAEEQKKQIELDMSFTQTTEEKSEKDKKQARKDFIRKMTRGRWTSEEKYKEYMAGQKTQVRI